MTLAGLRAFLSAGFCTALLAACSDETPAGDPSPALGARSAHAFVVMGPGGETRDHLLSGVAGPDADLHPAAAAEAEARAALDALIAGQTLSVTPAGEPDRYDRTPAQAALPDGRDLAAALVETGWAMVWPREGQAADFEALFAAEERARQDNAGAWAEGVFKVLDPDPNTLAQRLDGPVIVTGRIVSTGEGRDGRLYLNFGLDWRTDFTVSATRQIRSRFEDSGVSLELLDEAVVRARGWLYAENGPMIALNHTAQIEVLDAP